MCPMWLASDETIGQGCWFIGMLTCEVTHMDTHTEWSVCLSHRNFFVSSLFSQSAFECDGESGRHQREVCAGIYSATRVTCDYRSEDLNEYTIFGLFTLSLCSARLSQSAVYPINTPCLCLSGAAQGLVALLRGNLRGIIVEGEWVNNSHFSEFTIWSFALRPVILQ